MPGDISAEQFRALFVTVARALSFDALRLKPREKQLALLLALESFGEGSAGGAVDLKAWRERLRTWRSNELKDMLANWRRAGWVAVDVVESNFYLAPDRFPGWADVQVIQKSEERVRFLALQTEEDLHKTLARCSAARAIEAEVTKFSQVAADAKISQLGGKGGNVSETFNRLTSERINVKRCPEPGPAKCENFAGGTPAETRNPKPETSNAEALKNRVRAFVGEGDWTHPSYWNCGLGYQGRIFVEEYSLLEGALSYCLAALTEKHSAIRITKNKGAMLWNQFQRMRQEALK